MASAPMRQNYLHCEALVREGDHDRFLASLFAPAERRPHLHALYAFNIEVARVGEIVHEALAGEIRLQWWRDALAGQARGEATAHPVAAALMDTIASCSLETDALNELIDARARDLYGEPFATVEDLETYGRRTASTVFTTAARILEASAAPAGVADAAGAAYALAGLLQAFPQHAARGRIYIPLDVLDRHGVAGGDLTRGQASAGLRGAINEMIALARARLDEARRTWGELPIAARPALLPVALVSPLLARIAANGDPFRPVTLAPWRRQWLLWRAARRGAP
jgi:15-cis-phytoene synthase